MKKGLLYFSYAMLALIILGIPNSALAQTANLDEAIRQSKGDDSGVYPAGVPPSYSWYDGGDRGGIGPRPPPAGFTALAGWGQVNPQVGYPNVACTVYHKNHQTWVHLKSGGWILAEDATRPSSPHTIAGGNFVADFKNNAGYELMINELGDGQRTFASPPTNYCAHWWTEPRGQYPADAIDGALTMYAVRVDNPNCHLVAVAGIDYWRDQGAPYVEPVGTNNPALGGGSWVTVTTSYQFIYYTNFTREQLLADPPPPFRGGSTPAPSPTPQPQPQPQPPPPPPSPAPVTPGSGNVSPSTVLASQMVGTTGALQGDAYNLWTNGSINHTVYVSNSGIYDIQVEAFGSVAAGIYPLMRVLVDSVAIKTVTVREATLHRFQANLKAGSHKISVEFMNDGSGPNGQDRNLYVRKIIVANNHQPQTPTPTPAPSPSTLFGTTMPIRTTGAVQGDVYNIWSNGSLSQVVSFPTGGVYRLDIEAFGSPAGGVYPIAQLLVDDRIVATFTVNSATLKNFSIANLQFSAGNHKIGVAFTNDAHVNGQDRNLFIKKIDISKN